MDNFTVFAGAEVRATLASPSHQNGSLQHTSHVPGEYYQPDSSDIIKLILASVAVLANSLVLAGVARIRHSSPSRYALMMGLLASDAFVALLVILDVANNMTNPPTAMIGTGLPDVRRGTWCARVVIKAFYNAGLTATLFHLMGMAIDHFVAILMPFRYKKLLGIRRVCVAQIFLWVFAFLAGFSDFFVSLLWGVSRDADSRIREYLLFCEYVWFTLYQEEYLVLFLFFVCLGVMTALYVKIYMSIRFFSRDAVVNSQPQAPAEPGSDAVPRNRRKSSIIHRKRNVRALVTTALILGSYTVCWLPVCIYQLVLIILVQVHYKLVLRHQETLYVIDKYLVVLLLFNTICDPVIYAIRLAEIRESCKQACLVMLCVFVKKETYQHCAGSAGVRRRIRSEEEETITCQRTLPTTEAQENDHELPLSPTLTSSLWSEL